MVFYEGACELLRAYYAMKREIARKNEVTSVEYVRYRLDSRYTIGRLKHSVHGVYHLHGIRPAGKPVCFSDRV